MRKEVDSWRGMDLAVVSAVLILIVYVLLLVLLNDF